VGWLGHLARHFRDRGKIEIAGIEVVENTVEVV
jgi:hypothetical protein